MSYAVKLTANNKANLLECFQPEITKDKRSSWSLTKKNNDLIFTIQAKDAVALRATLNSIAKLFTVHEKIKNG